MILKSCFASLSLYLLSTRIQMNSTMFGSRMESRALCMLYKHFSTWAIPWPPDKILLTSMSLQEHRCNTAPTTSFTKESHLTHSQRTWRCEKSPGDSEYQRGKFILQPYKVGWPAREKAKVTTMPVLYKTVGFLKNYITNLISLPAPWIPHWLSSLVKYNLPGV